MSIDATHVVKLKTLQPQWVKSTSYLIAIIAYCLCLECGNLIRYISRATDGVINEPVHNPVDNTP
jgi:hypothetical protein